MTSYEICLTVFSALSILTSFTISLISILYINKRKELYLLKKEAIFEVLKFLDDFLSTKTFDTYAKDQKVITRFSNTGAEELTFRARECFNKLILTCKNSEIIDTFCKIILPQYYYEDGFIKMKDYHMFRMLCRKELGLKKEPKYNSKDITFLANIK